MPFEAERKQDAVVEILRRRKAPAQDDKVSRGKRTRGYPSEVGAGAGEETSVERQRLAGHEGGAVGAHPEDGFGDFRGFAETADGMLREDAFVDFWRVEEPVGHGGFDDGGADGVDANAVFGAFERSGFGEA